MKSPHVGPKGLRNCKLTPAPTQYEYSNQYPPPPPPKFPKNFNCKTVQYSLTFCSIIPSPISDSLFAFPFWRISSSLQGDLGRTGLKAASYMGTGERHEKIEGVCNGPLAKCPSPQKKKMATPPPPRNFGLCDPLLGQPKSCRQFISYDPHYACLCLRYPFVCLRRCLCHARSLCYAGSPDQYATVDQLPANPV